MIEKIKIDLKHLKRSFSVHDLRWKKTLYRTPGHTVILTKTLMI